jgi:hypothetical protein
VLTAPTPQFGLETPIQTGDQVTLNTTCGDPALATAKWADRAGDILVKDGAITDAA